MAGASTWKTRGTIAATVAIAATWILHERMFESAAASIMSRSPRCRSSSSASIRRDLQSSRSSVFEIFNDSADVLPLVFREAAVLCQMQQQAARGAVEHPVDEIAHHRADDLLPWPRGLVHIGALDPRLLQVALVLENLHHRHHRGVSDGTLHAQLFVDIADRGLVELPDHLHDGEFLRCEGRVRRSH